ncbi:MAG TPA: Holliday junction resolvase RuvX [Ignavibacteria bacterium]|nr:Holliday junction resolvase RuvX [Ignavibacteria bacterium]
MENNENLKRILAIDYGTKRIGIALTDPLITFSYPFKTILNDGNLQKEFSKIISEKNVDRIILGFPVMENGQASNITKLVLKFKKKLEKWFNLQVILQDENYTSEMAKQVILQSVTKKSKRRDKGLIDQNSAAIILQDYLQSI